MTGMPTMKAGFLAVSLIAAIALPSCSGGSGGGGSPEPPFAYTYALPADIGDNWLIGSLAEASVDQALIVAATRGIVGSTYTGIDSFAIVRHGRLVHDVYFGEFDARTRHDLRSATKSITSMLVGIAIDRGHIGDESEPALSYITSYPAIANWDDRKNSIEIGHLLTMTPGLDCDDWNSASPGNEANMYPRTDWVKFLVDLPMISDPGTVFGYCTAGVVALGQVIHEATGQPADEFAEDELFGPLGMTSLFWEYSPGGQVDTGGHIHLRPRDMAKLGQLMLQRGMWDGQVVISDTWTDRSTGFHVTTANGSEYGYLWWRREFDQYQAYYAAGNGGQFIFVVPDLDLVAVFTGSNYNSDQLSPAHEIMERYVVPAML